MYLCTIMVYNYHNENKQGTNKMNFNKEHFEGINQLRIGYIEEAKKGSRNKLLEELNNAFYYFTGQKNAGWAMGCEELETAAQQYIDIVQKEFDKL